MLISKGVVNFFITTIKDVRVKSVLVSSAHGLKSLCQSKEEGESFFCSRASFPRKAKTFLERVLAEIRESDVIPIVAALLQLNIPELSVELCQIIESVCGSGMRNSARCSHPNLEDGVRITIQSGAVALLTPLLESPDSATQEKALLALGRLFFSPGMVISCFMKLTKRTPLCFCGTLFQPSRRISFIGKAHVHYQRQSCISCSRSCLWSYPKKCIPQIKLRKLTFISGHQKIVVGARTHCQSRRNGTQWYEI